MQTDTTWMLDEVLTGLQQLLCLSLERTPASELIPGTARAWVQAITTGKTWDQHRDTPRLRAAFVTLTQNRRTWPVPVDLLEALPKLTPHQLALPTSPSTAEHAANCMATIADELRTPPRWAGEREQRHGMPSMSDASRELARELDARSQNSGEQVFTEDDIPW